MANFISHVISVCWKIFIPIIRNFISTQLIIYFSMQHPIVKTIKSRMVAVKSLEDLTYLDLSGIECKVLPKEAKTLLQRCNSLQQLILNNCGLQSLENLPNIQISIIQLSSNRLSDQQLQRLIIYSPCLQQMNLQNNKISDIFTISIFRNFPRLEEINLKGNPICSTYPNYNEQIFTSILSLHPALKIIDCFRKNGEIISDQEGKDQQLDGPLWMLSQNIQEEESNQNNSSKQSDDESQLNSYNSTDKKSNLIRLYQQNITTQPGFMIKYLNENQRFVDPLENCFDQEMDFEDEEDQEQFRSEIQTGGFKYKQTKKRKCEYKFDPNQEY